MKRLLSHIRSIAEPGKCLGERGVLDATGVAAGLDVRDLGIDVAWPGWEQHRVWFGAAAETPDWAVAVLVLSQPGSIVPLHTHPGMHVGTCVLHGGMSVMSVSTAEPPSRGRWQPGEALRRTLQAGSRPALACPDQDNLHQFEWRDVGGDGGICVVVDVLSPPYDPEGGRDCVYCDSRRAGECGDQLLVRANSHPPRTFYTAPLAIPQDC